MKKRIAALGIVLSLTAVGAAFSGADEKVAARMQPSDEPYVPGLGDLMGAIQVRHAKLWFAGAARNWPLAAYELHEIEEGFEDAARHHPLHRGKPIADLIDSLTKQPIADLQRAVTQRNAARFEPAFDALSQACNACHQENGYGFIAIRRPTAPPVTNQDFAAPGGR